MTAIRVIDDHEDLDNVGAITHQQLDNYIDHARWILGPGSNPSPPSSLTITAGDGISITETGNQLIVTNTSLHSGNTTGVTWNFMEIPVGSVNDNNVTFTLTAAPHPSNSLMLFVNGVLQVSGPDVDYTLIDNVITLTTPPLLGSKIVATYSYSASGSTIAWMEPVAGDIDDVNMVFSLSCAPNPSSSLMLFVNGILQLQDIDYALSGKNITLFTAPFIGSNLAATYQY